MGTKRQMAADPMFRAEKTIRDKQRERSNKERLEDLEELQAEREDTYELNCALRRRNRAKRKEEKEAEEAARRAGPQNFALTLVAPSTDDVAEAKGIHFRTDHDSMQLSVRRAAARAAPLFDTAATSSGKKRQLAETSNGTREPTRPHDRMGLAPAAELAAKRRRVALNARMAHIFK